MKYLFFDTECANCFEGAGKICELGYLLTEENFSVIKKGEFIINPGAEFDKKGFAMRKIKLTYPYAEYYKKKKFPAFFDEIKSMFTEDNLLVVGHGTHFDAKYLLQECERYGLTPFDYSFVDTQEIVKKLYDRETKLRLIELYSEFFPEDAHEQMHSGVDDAFMTAEVLRHVIEDKGISIADIVGDKQLLCDVFDGRIVEGSVFGYNGSDVMGRRNKALFKEYIAHNNSLATGDYYSFPTEYEAKHFPQMMRILELMTENGMRYTDSVKKSTYVTTGEKEWKARYVRNGRSITLADFLAKFGYTEEELDGEEVDVDGILSRTKDNAVWYAKYLEYKRNKKII